MGRVALSAVVVAIALGLGAPARSAPVTFDLEGVVGWWVRSTDANASNPAFNGGTCTLGMQSPPPPNGAGNDCFRYAFAPGSSVTIDITGAAVTMLGGSLVVDAVAPLVLNTIVLTLHHETTIAGGATGTLDGPRNSIMWSNPAFVSTVGTIACAGPNCGLIAMPEGVVFPWEPTFSTLSNSTGVASFQFGEWILDASHTTITASCATVFRWSNSVELGNRRSGAFTFAPTGLGFCVPEPDSAALMLLGLGALGLLSRRAGSR